jgi:hypothetical protein
VPVRDGREARPAGKPLAIPRRSFICAAELAENRRDSR